MKTIVFYIVLFLPGQPPIEHGKEMPSIEACLDEVAQALKKAMESEQAGEIQTGCSVSTEESKKS